MIKLLLSLFVFSVSIACFAQPMYWSSQVGTQVFLSDVRRALPPIISEQFKSPIEIRFKNFGEQNRISLDRFSNESSEKQVLNGYIKKTKTIFAKDKVIFINKSFLPFITSGEPMNAEFPCGHQSVYKTAVATVLHETMHLYDFTNFKRNDLEKEILNKCRTSFKNGRYKKTTACRKVRSIQANISHRPQFLNLLNWSNKRVSKNNLISTSEDVYEFKNAEESLATHFEYFALDDEFACRRPAIYQFLKNQLQHDPYPCQTHTKIIQYGSDDLAWLNPDRIYQVHYLLAGDGQKLMSKWGHAMVRFVICAPHRENVGPNCLKDVSHHLVASYRAYIDEPEINYYKSIVGKYPSQVMMMPMTRIAYEYGRTELRDLYSFPLNLNRQQIQMVTYKTLEAYWNYSGDYKFFTNNCADESWSLILSAIESTHPIHYEFISTPKAINKALIKTGLSIDLSSISRSQLLSKGYLFPSSANSYDKLFLKLQQSLNIPYKDLRSFVEISKPLERLEYVRQAKADKDFINLVSSFYLFESHIYRIKFAALDKQALNMLSEYNGKEGSLISEKIITYQQQLNQLNEALQPHNLVLGSRYGNPLSGEWKLDNPAKSNYAKFVKNIESYREEIVPELYPEEYLEVLQIKDNIKKMEALDL